MGVRLFFAAMASGGISGVVGPAKTLVVLLGRCCVPEAEAEASYVAGFPVPLPFLC